MDDDSLNSKVGRATRDQMREFIRNWTTEGIQNDSRCIKGLDALKTAVDEDDIKAGQIIFQESVFTGVKKPLNYIMIPVLGRDFKFFHVAVFVGKHNNDYYVVENGGSDKGGKNVFSGTVALRNFKNAFGNENSKFFVVTPPLVWGKEGEVEGQEEGNESSRDEVMQNALACIGLEYIYDVLAVSCESFALAMFQQGRKFDPVQHGSLPTSAVGKFLQELFVGSPDENKFDQFYEDLADQMKRKPTVLTLTLEQYIEEQPKNNKLWYKEIVQKKILEITKNKGSVEELVDWTEGARPGDDLAEHREQLTGMTPLHYAAKMGCEDLYSILVHNGANWNVKDNYGKTPNDLKSQN